MASKNTFRRKATSTSSFGTAGRISHDASSFYASRLYDGLRVPGGGEVIEHSIDAALLNRIFLQSSESMDNLPDSSVHLMVTSPPYNVKKEYDNDLTLDEYRSLLRSVFTETYRVLVDGGRACVNVANLGRKPYVPLHSYIIEEMHGIGFQMRGEIIWDKGASASPSTAWGSWRSASNPTLRDVHEYILIFSKGNYRRVKGEKENTIGRDQFLEYTKSVWTFPAERARKIGHPAPFPVELPRRLVELYTFKGDVVLDPFCGSGATCVAAALSERNYVAYEINDQYVELATKRIMAALDHDDVKKPGRGGTKRKRRDQQVP